MTDSTLTEDDAAPTPEYLGDMTVVARFVSVQEALTLKGCLVAAGIPATVGDQNLMMQGGGWMGGVASGVRVLVPATLVARANEVIAEFRSGAFEIEGDADPELRPATTATDLALWNSDLAVFLSLPLTPIFGATLLWQNSRKLGQTGLARVADVGLALSVVVTAAGFWLLRDHDWSVATPFSVSGAVGVYTAFWYLFLAHGQSRFITRSFGRQYRHRNVWTAAAIALGLMLAVGFGHEALIPN